MAVWDGLVMERFLVLLMCCVRLQEEEDAGGQITM